MKTKRNRKSGYFTLVFISIMMLVFLTHDIHAQWIHDAKYGFKIKLPSDWSKKSYMDGTDKVYDFYSADQNAAIQLRLFKTDNRVTTDILVQVYEQNMLPKGTNRQSLVNHTTRNGIPGKAGVYSMVYNGNQVTMAAFYTVQNHKGYVLTALVPTSMMQQKGPEVKSITQSFMLDGIAPTTHTYSGTKNPVDAGNSSSRYVSSGGIAGGTNQFVIRSHYAYDFSQGKVLTFAKSTGGIAVYGGCDGLPQIEGKFIVTNYRRFENASSWNKNALSNVYRSGSKRVPLNRVCIYQLRDGSFAKFMVVDEKHENTSHGCVRVLTLRVEYPAVTNYHASATGSRGNVAGKYNFISRSDGKNLLNYWYIILKKDGTYVDKHQLNNKNQYTTGEEGTWKVKGNKLTLYNKYYPAIQTSYTIQGNRLISQSSNGVTFVFKKQ